MVDEVEEYVTALTALAPVASSSLSPADLRALVNTFVNNPTSLKGQLIATPGRDNAHAPIFLYLHDIAIYCAQIYGIYEIARKSGEFGGSLVTAATFILNNDKKVETAEAVIAISRQLGLNIMADKMEAQLDRVLEQLTKPSIPPRE
jgi:hypothetical protein